MRETERSLRAYFLFAGVIAAGLALRDLGTISKLGGMSLPASWMLALWFPVLGRLGLGIAYVLAGLTLPKALQTGGGWIKTLLLVAIALLVTDAILIGSVLGSDLGREGMISSFVGLVVTAYLLANVRRLADEAMAKQPPPARVA